MATCFHEASQIIETTRSRGLSRWCLTTLLPAVTFLFLAVPVLLGQARGGNAALQAASVAERSGRYEEASTLYEQFLASTADSSADPSTLVHARTRLATAYFLLHRYRESLEAVAPLTSNDSRRAGVPAQTWLVDGLDRLELGQLPEAIASLERTLVLNPTSGTARLALGDAFERSGRLEEAAREYEEQTRVTPSAPDAWYKLGLAYARLVLVPALAVLPAEKRSEVAAAANTRFRPWVRFAIFLLVVSGLYRLSGSNWRPRTCSPQETTRAPPGSSFVCFAKPQPNPRVARTSAQPFLSWDIPKLPRTSSAWSCLKTPTARLPGSAWQKQRPFGEIGRGRSRASSRRLARMRAN